MSPALHMLKHWGGNLLISKCSSYLAGLERSEISVPGKQGSLMGKGRQVCVRPGCSKARAQWIFRSHHDRERKAMRSQEGCEKATRGEKVNLALSTKGFLSKIQASAASWKKSPETQMKFYWIH